MSDFELPKEPVVEEGNPAEGDLSKKEEKKPKFSADELFKIFDEIIFAGTYSEVVTIRGKLKVKFRTRTTEETEEIGQKVDSTTANLASTLNEKRMLLNLTYALISYQGKDLSLFKVEEKEKFVNKLPAPIVGVLIQALSNFDIKVYEACKDAEENF